MKIRVPVKNAIVVELVVFYLKRTRNEAHVRGGASNVCGMKSVTLLWVATVPEHINDQFLEDIINVGKQLLFF